MQLWFKNHRAKVKRQKLEISCSNLASNVASSSSLIDCSESKKEINNKYYSNMETSLEHNNINRTLDRHENTYRSLEDSVLCFKTKEN